MKMVAATFWIFWWNTVNEG